MRSLILFALLQIIFFNNIFIYAQWVKVDSPDSSVVYGLFINGANYYLRTNLGLFISFDLGSTWTSINNGLPAVPRSIAVNGTYTFVGFDGDGVYVSTNNGSDWNPANNGLTNKRVDCLQTNGNNIFAGTVQGGIFLSTNNGNSWNEVNNGIPTDNRLVKSMAIGNLGIYATISQKGLYVSNDNGSNWDRICSGDLGAIAVNDSSIYSSIYRTGIYYSLDNGLTWSLIYVGPNQTTSFGFAFSGPNVFVANGDGVFLSRDNGTNWEDINSNNTGLIATSLTVDGDTIFAIYGYTGEIWYRLISQILTDVNENLVGSPSYYDLSQNYPNPFNPTTSFTYLLPQSEKVTIRVYDVLGTEIEKLVNEEKLAGTYEITWNAANLPSGVYFYQLRAGDFIDTKKMILMK